MLLTQVTHIILFFLCSPVSNGYRTHDGVLVVEIIRRCLVVRYRTSQGALPAMFLPIWECGNVG